MTNELEKNLLKSNWKFIIQHYEKVYSVETLFCDDEENILFLKDKHSGSTNPKIFVVAYLHLLNGSAFWLSKEINLFIYEIKQLIEKQNWNTSPSWKEANRFMKRNKWNDNGTLYEIRVILNFPLRQLANSQLSNIIKDVKYYLITAPLDANSSPTIKEQDLLLESIEGNKLTHNGIKEAFEKYGRNTRRRTASQYWHCDICDGDSETGCLYFDPSECPKHS